MSKQEWVKKLAFPVVVLFVISCSLKLYAATCAGCTSCEEPCQTHRDGSSKSLPSVDTGDGAGGIGGGGGSDQQFGAPLPNSSYGITKVLRQCDFTPQYKITCPGTYVFGETIKYQGQEENKPALVICSDDVIVDLNGYALIYELCESNLSRKDNVSGVSICSGKRNITVRNGTVRLFTKNGIEGIAEADQTVDGKFIDGKIKSIIIDNMILLENQIGIQLKGYPTSTDIDTDSSNSSSFNPVVDVKIVRTTASCNETGIQFNTVKSGFINRCMTNENTATSGSSISNGVGIELINSKKITVRKCIANCNSGAGSKEGLGIYLHNGGTSGLETINSIVYDNRVEVNETWGIKDGLNPSSTVYTRNFALNNATDGGGNYEIFFVTSGNPGGNLVNFTKVATLADLQNLNNAGDYDNISVGTSGTAATDISPS